jgi:HD-GYP domain-containing protein (c-di-GMP phosphodiesterase class II)
MLRLTIQLDEEQERIVSFEDEGRRVRFGRALENDIVLSRAYASRFHGEFYFEEGQWFVIDQASQVGILVVRGRDSDSLSALTPNRGYPLRGDEEIRILGIRIRVELKPVDGYEPPMEVDPGEATMVLSRVAETQIAQADSLQHQLFSDRHKLERVLDLAKDLNRLETLDEVLRRISRTVFEALGSSTHFAVCVPGPDSTYEPRFGILRDGSELPLDEITVSQSILEMVVERESAMLFRLGDMGGDPSKSMVVHSIASSIAVPLRGARGTTGVLVVDNRSSLETFQSSDLDYMIVLAHHATSALERARFQAEIGRMFEGFVDAAVTAIESRDPTTSGHSRRVATYAVALADAATRSGTGAMAPISFSTAQVTELSYAALLHDFGKVGVPECVLVKANRLYPEQLAALEARFQLIRASYRNAVLREGLMQRGVGDATSDQLSGIEQRIELFDRELTEVLAFIRTIDEGGEVLEEHIARIRAIAERTYIDVDDNRVAYLSEQDLEVLSIPRGTLTDTERSVIQAHVPHSVRVLRQIPWPEVMQKIPEIVRSHHEKLDGSGYPQGLRAEEIPVESRLLTVVDIFDAVTAADRPYRSALPLDRGLDLLREEASQGKIDRDFTALFTEARIWEIDVSETTKR